MSTAPTGWQTPKTDWQANNVVTAPDFNRIEGNIDAIEQGLRTLDPSQAPSGNTGTLRQLLDWFANRIKAITGKTNWYDAPDTTLAAAKVHIDAQTGVHGATSAPTAGKLVIRDAAGRAQVADPSATQDIATKAYADTVGASAAAALSSHAAATSGVHGAPSGQLLLHAGDKGVANGLATLDSNSRVVQRTALKGALVYRSDPYSLQDAFYTAIPFDTEVYDSDAFWNSGTPTRVTIPAGVSLVRFRARVSFNPNAVGDRGVVIHKNGSTQVTRDLPFVRHRAANQNTDLMFASVPISVAPGDYFELKAFQNSGSAVNVYATLEVEVIG